MVTRTQHWSTRFYWLGVALTVVCSALVLTSNTERGWQFEHVGFPLSWTLGCGAVLAFLIAEFCGYKFSLHHPVEDRSLEPAVELEAADY